MLMLIVNLNAKVVERLHIIIVWQLHSIKTKSNLVPNNGQLTLETYAYLSIKLNISFRNNRLGSDLSSIDKNLMTYILLDT